MNVNQLRVKSFMQAIPVQRKDVAERPTIVSEATAVLRARLMLEECLETIVDGLGVQLRLNVAAGERVIATVPINFEEITFRPYQKPDLVLIADGLADCEVVNLGTAVVCGIDVQPVFDVVMDNNELKLKTGTIDERGKLRKAADHPKPDIEAVLKRQSGSVRSGAGEGYEGCGGH